MNQEAFDFTASILVERLGLRRESALKMAAAHYLYDALKVTLGNIQSLKAAQAPGLETYDAWLDVVGKAIRKAEGQ